MKLVRWFQFGGRGPGWDKALRQSMWGKRNQVTQQPTAKSDRLR